MMLRRRLEEIWENFWEGQLFLINIASQIESGVLEEKARQDFIDALVDYKKPIERIADLGPLFFGPDSVTRRDFTMCGSIATEHCTRFILRVAPLKNILKSSVLLDAVGAPDWDRANTAADQLRLLLAAPRPSNSSQDFSNAEKNFEEAERQLLATMFPSDLATARFAGWDLPDVLRDIPLAPAQVDSGIGVALQGASDAPKFFAPIFENCPVCAAIPRSHTSAGGQRIRDLLGLDGYGPTYGTEATVLGFFIIEFDDRHGEVRRPTAFDWTSRARFRARYGSSGKSVGKMGRTVDLTRIDPAAEKLHGAREIVGRAQSFNQYPARVLLGYLGRLEPKVEAYDEGKRSMSDTDRAFVEHLQGHWTRDDVITIISQGAT